MKKKINKDNSGKKTKKIIKKKKKKPCGEHYSNPRYFKEKKYKAKFSINYILKKNKINKNNSEKKIILKKKKQKNRKK